jgi:hypothetical protein
MQTKYNRSRAKQKCPQTENAHRKKKVYTRNETKTNLGDIGRQARRRTDVALARAAVAVRADTVRRQRRCDDDDDRSSYRSVDRT